MHMLKAQGVSWFIQVHKHMLEQMVQVFQIFLRSLLPDVFIIDSPPIGTFLKWKYTEQLTTIFFWKNSQCLNTL